MQFFIFVIGLNANIIPTIMGLKSIVPIEKLNMFSNSRVIKINPNILVTGIGNYVTAIHRIIVIDN
jgi:hypothetical protein